MKPETLYEYRAVRESAGFLDRSRRGKLVLTGADRLTWLQGMVSNDVRPLAEGAAFVDACVLDATGHLLADIRNIARPDSLLIDVARERVEWLFRRLDGFIITEDVEIADQSDSLACLSVQGPAAASERVQRLAGEAALIVPADHTGSGGYDLYVRAEEASGLRERLAEDVILPVGEEAAEVLRIEAGIPLYGVDMDESTIPLEAGLEATHISHTKGCYVGQEIIARIHARGHTNRALSGVIIEGSMLPQAGDRIFVEETGGDSAPRDVGWVTSATRSRTLERGIALAYLRHEHRTPGTPLRIHREGEVLPAEAAALPFVRPS